MRDQKLIFEGEKLVRDILNRGIDVSAIILHESQEGIFCVPDWVNEVWYVSDSVLTKISTLKNRPMFMVVMDPISKPVDLELSDSVIILDNIQDPVNMGSVFRCAAAFGISDIILTGNSVKITNSKFLRVAQDSYFAVNHQYVNSLKILLETLNEKEFFVYLTVPGDALDHVSLGDINFPCAVVFGNEGQGIESDLLGVYPSIKIDQTSDVDSLNVGMCACIVMYELQKLK